MTPGFDDTGFRDTGFRDTGVVLATAKARRAWRRQDSSKLRKRNPPPLSRETWRIALIYQKPTQGASPISSLPFRSIPGPAHLSLTT